jgi:hypothetical protein
MEEVLFSMYRRGYAWKQGRPTPPRDGCPTPSSESNYLKTLGLRTLALRNYLKGKGLLTAVLFSKTYGTAPFCIYLSLSVLQSGYLFLCNCEDQLRQIIESAWLEAKKYMVFSGTSKSVLAAALSRQSFDRCSYCGLGRGNYLQCLRWEERDCRLLKREEFHEAEKRFEEAEGLTFSCARRPREAIADHSKSFACGDLAQDNCVVWNSAK